MDRTSPLRSIATSRLSALVSAATAGCGRRLARSVRAVAFWLAIPLSLILVIALLAGLSGQRPVLFGTLLFASIVSTVVGHEHVPGRG